MITYQLISLSSTKIVFHLLALLLLGLHDFGLAAPHVLAAKHRIAAVDQLGLLRLPLHRSYLLFVAVDCLFTLLR